MRRGLQLSMAFVTGLLGGAALVSWFDDDTVPEPVVEAKQPTTVTAATMAKRVETKAAQTTKPAVAAAVNAALDAQALELLSPYLRECGASTFAVQGGYGDSMYEFRGLMRTMTRRDVGAVDALNRVDWTGSVGVTWTAERKRCLDCGADWEEWTGAGSAFMDARHKNGAWLPAAPNATFIQLNPEWTCEWFQRPAEPPSAATPESAALSQ